MAYETVGYVWALCRDLLYHFSLAFPTLQSKTDRLAREQKANHAGQLAKSCPEYAE